MTLNNGSPIGIDQNRVLMMAGTRPEIIKLAPVYLALKKSLAIRPLFISTGQHRELVEDALFPFKIRLDHNFQIMSEANSLDQVMSLTFAKSSQLFAQENPAAVIVQGDTSTAATVAICAYNNKIPVAHVEAGLRTGNLLSPHPEEGNRKIISQVANWHFTPTKKATENLLNEGVDKASIHEVGNTVIDALQYVSKQLDNDLDFANNFHQKYGCNPKSQKIVLITCHRRENFGQPIRQILKAIRDLAGAQKNTVFIFPIHPNPEVQNAIKEVLKVPLANLILTMPLNYQEMVYLMKNCHFAMTDSGGLQEELPTFKKPILVLRDTTERPEAVEQGFAKLVGSAQNLIVDHAIKLLEDDSYYLGHTRGTNPFGDGQSAKKITNIIGSSLTE
jgi:UDP-N-acetylglucosamine 2-epimerase (non-hydrolysing)